MAPADQTFSRLPLSRRGHCRGSSILGDDLSELLVFVATGVAFEVAAKGNPCYFPDTANQVPVPPSREFAIKPQ